VHFSHLSKLISAPGQGFFSRVYDGHPPQKHPQAGIRPVYSFIVGLLVIKLLKEEANMGGGFWIKAVTRYDVLYDVCFFFP